jgi:hypothetical protein
MVPSCEVTEIPLYRPTHGEGAAQPRACVPFFWAPTPLYMGTLTSIDKLLLDTARLLVLMDAGVIVLALSSSPPNL